MRCGISLLLAVSLVIQIAALAIVFGVLGRRAFRLIGPAFVAIAVVFHGGTELIEIAGLAPNRYRAFVSQDAIDNWVWIVSIAILLMAAGYVLTLGRVGPHPQRPDVKVLSWPLLLVAAAPMYALALAGRASSEETYWLGGLATQFLILAFVLASFDFIRRHEGRYFVPVLIAQSLLLAPVGSRWSVVAGALLTVWCLAHVGALPTRRQGLLVIAIAFLATAVISSARVATIGPDSHFYASSGATSNQRADLMFRGVTALPRSLRSQAFWADWVYRVDGNAFPTLVRVASPGLNAPPLGFDRLLTTGLVAVPKFVYSGKSNLDPGLLNEEVAVVARYNLPKVDYLDPTLGMLYIYLGGIGMCVAALLLGIAFALLDRWLIGRVTAVRLVAGLGVLLCVLLYEQGVQVYPLTLRGVVTLVVVVKLGELVVGFLARSRRLGRPSPGTEYESMVTSSSR